jgi:hypothetical protein
VGPIYLFDINQSLEVVPKEGIFSQEISLIFPEEMYLMEYEGHVNVRTSKEVNFFGTQSEFVVSGSDDGKVLKKT